MDDSIFGGKWTTYRQMAEDTVNTAIKAQLLEDKPCQTYDLRLHGYVDPTESTFAIDDPLAVYGSDADAIRELAQAFPELQRRIHLDYPYTYAQIEWAIYYEMAQTLLEDVLARRLRLLFLDTQATADVAVDVAEFMADRLGWDDDIIRSELENMAELVDLYSL